MLKNKNKIKYKINKYIASQPEKRLLEIASGRRQKSFPQST
jgi:hypothetical protein